MLGGLSKRFVYFIMVSKNTRYTRHRLPKKGGGVREVFEADDALKAVQFQLLTTKLNDIDMPSYLYAFEHGRKARDMAEVNSRKAFVLSWDIKDFFPSIKQMQIFEVLSRFYPEKEARLYSELVTFHSFLPQGAVTSPKIANIVSANTFAPELCSYFQQLGGVYTQYADDITVSFESMLSLRDVANHTKTVADVLSMHRFRLNRKKTKAMAYTKRQYVLGAVVNAKVNLPREGRDRLKAAVHGVSVRGVAAEAERFNMSEEQFLSSLRGRLNWYKQLNPERGGKLYEQFRSITGARNDGSGLRPVNAGDEGSAARP
jgi:RNA-directed DNA polymerase